jgi:hypothetical protein
MAEKEVPVECCPGRCKVLPITVGTGGHCDRHCAAEAKKLRNLTGRRLPVERTTLESEITTASILMLSFPEPTASVVRSNPSAWSLWSLVRDQRKGRPLDDWPALICSCITQRAKSRDWVVPDARLICGNCDRSPTKISLAAP